MYIMKTTNNITSLGTTLSDLYEGNVQLNIKLIDKPFVFHVVLKDRQGIDCKISSFGANLWARTNKGMNYKKYTTLKGLQIALVKLIDKKVDAEGPIEFSISDEVYAF